MRLPRLGSFLPIFRGGYDCARYPLLRRFPVNAVHFHKRLNGDLDKIMSRSAHLLVKDWVARSFVPCEISGFA